MTSPENTPRGNGTRSGSRSKVVPVMGSVVVLAAAAAAGVYFLGSNFTKDAEVRDTSNTVEYKLNTNRAKSLANGYKSALAAGDTSAQAITGDDNAPQDRTYALADLDGDAEPELLVGAQDSKGNAWVKAMGIPTEAAKQTAQIKAGDFDIPAGAASDKEFLDYGTLQGTGLAKEYIESLRAPKPTSPYSGVHVGGTSSTGAKAGALASGLAAAAGQASSSAEDGQASGGSAAGQSGEAASDPSAAVDTSTAAATPDQYLVLQGGKLTVRDHPAMNATSANDGADAQATPTADDFGELHIPAADATDTAVLDDLVAKASDSVPEPKDTTLYGLWKYQLANYKQLEVPVQDAATGEVTGKGHIASVDNVQLQDINGDGYAELGLTGTPEGSQDRHLWVLTYNPTTANAYIATPKFNMNVGNGAGSVRQGLAMNPYGVVRTGVQLALVEKSLAVLEGTTLVTANVSKSGTRDESFNVGSEKLDARAENFTTEQSLAALPALDTIRIPHEVGLASLDGLIDAPEQATSSDSSPQSTANQQGDAQQGATGENSANGSGNTQAAGVDYAAKAAEAKSQGKNFIYGTVTLTDRAGLLKIQGKQEPNPGTPNAQFVVVQSAVPVSITLRSGDGSRMSTREFGIFATDNADQIAQLQAFAGQQKGVLFGPDDGYWNSDTSLPLGGFAVRSFTVV